MEKITIGRKRLISIKNLILMAVILVVILAAVFSWYTESYSVTAETTSISAKGADNVELALPDRRSGSDAFPFNNDAWKTTLEFSKSGFLKDLVKDVTSDGKQFAVPTFAAAKGLKEGRTVIADDVWTDGLSSKEALTNTSTLDDDQYNYISLDFYVRSKIKDINVTAESFLATGSELGYQDANNPESTAKPLNGNDIYRSSSYGAGGENSFSADAIVGAMRVSLVGAPVSLENNTVSEGTSSLRFLWLPRPDIYLETDDNSNNWKLYTGIKPTGNSAIANDKTDAEMDKIAQETYCHSFYKGKIIENTTIKKGLDAKSYWDPVNYELDTVCPQGKETSNVFHVSKTIGDGNLGNTGHYPTLGQSASLATDGLDSSKSIKFTTGDPNVTVDGYYVYKFTLNIWIEGEDAEARRSMNNGVFKLELDFGPDPDL